MGPYSRWIAVLWLMAALSMVGWLIVNLDIAGWILLVLTIGLMAFELTRRQGSHRRPDGKLPEPSRVPEDGHS